MRIALACVVVLAACDGAPGSAVTWTNEGELCLDAAAATTTATDTAATTTPATDDTGLGVSFEGGDTVVLTVTFGGCDCGEETEASCSATRDGDVWTVSSEALSYTGCEPCEPVTTSCEVGVLADGTHTFQHGGDLVVVEVPGELAPACVGETTKGTKQ